MPNLTPQQVEDAARAMPDHTLATSFMEPEARARVIGLILFAHEISRARAVVSEAGLAAIRLQWWRDTVEQIYDGKQVRAQPTAIALAGSVREANLPRILLEGMIDGYESELDATPFETWSDVDSYLDATWGNLNRLCLLASGLPTISTDANEAARQAAVAWGLAHLVRTMPQWLGRRCHWLPDEVSANLDQEAMFSGNVSPALHGALALVKGRVAMTQKRANEALKRANLRTHFPALAHACLSGSYCRAAVPPIGQKWRVAPATSLLVRQLHITFSVARGKL
jgi:phytoene/squalene synthetase